MVAMMYEDDFTTNPKTLCDWVKNFRVKKIQMKRKFRGGGDLRVCAILSTALLSAEHALRRKQQERFNRWLEMQEKMSTNYVNNAMKGAYNNKEKITEGAEQQRLDEVSNLWKCELSGLDEFIRNMSSSSKCNNEIKMATSASIAHSEMETSLSNNCTIRVAS